MTAPVAPALPPVVFLVQGSAPDPYVVTFTNAGAGNLTASCTCPAGRVYQHCKHRHHILLGDVSDIVSDNAELAGLVYAWFQGSDVEATLREVDDLEAELVTIKKLLAAAKQRFAAAMRD